MILLSKQESREWSNLAQKVVYEARRPFPVDGFIRPGLIPAFHYYTGTWLLSEKQYAAGFAWVTAGISGEQGGLFSNSQLASYLGRNQGRLVVPEVIFSDPGPYIHFAATPLISDSRVSFRSHCVSAFPGYQQPLRIMDIGCGHGAVLIDLLTELRSAGRISDIGEILLIDPSEGMLNMARKNVMEAFPEVRLNTLRARFEELSGTIQGHYDIALASLAIHHMPFETKLDHLRKLKDHIDLFLLYELDANNDTPGLHSPDLALSVYQSYGSMIDAIFANDAPIELALASIDRFLMSEAVYFFTLPRGERTDYHMLRSQWHEVFGEGLGTEFSCLCDSMCYADSNMALFTMIYGKM